MLCHAKTPLKILADYFAALCEAALNTFTWFDAPSRDMCGWSMIAHA